MKAVRLLSSCNGHSYFPGDAPGNIAVRGWVDPRAIVRPQGLCQWIIQIMQSGIKSATFWLVAQCPNQMCHSVPLSILYHFYFHGSYHKQYDIRVNENNCKVSVLSSKLVTSDILGWFKSGSSKCTLHTKTWHKPTQFTAHFRKDTTHSRQTKLQPLLPSRNKSTKWLPCLISVGKQSGIPSKSVKTGSVFQSQPSTQTLTVSYFRSRT